MRPAGSKAGVASMGSMALMSFLLMIACTSQHATTATSTVVERVDSSSSSSSMQQPDAPGGEQRTLLLGATFAGYGGKVLGERPIQPITKDFKQGQEEWGMTGVSLTVTGEPMSGTMWLGRVVADLCFLLCGNARNPWCDMGELVMIPNHPAPAYSFEMLHADTGELLLHFKGVINHEIPGLEIDDGCNRGSYAHPRGLGKNVPCQKLNPVTRAGLAQCLPDISPLCMPLLPRLDPDLRRMAVVFRDPRNLVISEHEVRVNSFEESVEDIGVLEPFILDRFEIIVQWIHQRWVWHTTFLKTISHVMFYEDLQTNPGHLQDLAAFLGLDCSPDDAATVLRAHQYGNPPGDYTSVGLTFETLQWMNATMSAILPEAILSRYGLSPTDT